jgi:hypothetical protein
MVILDAIGRVGPILHVGGPPSNCAVERREPVPDHELKGLKYLPEI